MRIPKKVLIIGKVAAITYRPTKSRSAVSLDFEAKRGDFLLATNPTHTQLYIFENVRTGKVQAMTDAKGVVKGFIHELVEYEVPTTTLKHIGVILTIRYHTVWWEGEPAREYRHDFTKAALYADKYSRFKTIGIKTTKGKILNNDGITA
jgi:hypothetical protein